MLTCTHVHMSAREHVRVALRTFPQPKDGKADSAGVMVGP